MSSGGGAGPLVPTFHGFVHNSMDGLVLFEACLSGKLSHVPRRPHDRERNSLIKSGSIFIYEENASGIKRWTDGVAWSPSRILGNFLIYRELEKPFPPGEKKRAMKRKRLSLPGEPYPRRESDDTDTVELSNPLTPPSPIHQSADVKSDSPTSERDKELERSLIGSLVDSYGFRPDGLVKKTMSISVNGISHHMVSYYKVDDVKNNLLPRPLADPRLQNISVRPELYLKQNFRAPVEETEQYAIDGQMHAHPQMMYSNLTGSPYNIRPGQYFGGGQYSMYGMSSGANVYGGLTGTAWSGAPTQGLSYVGAGHAAYGSPAYGTPYFKSGSGADAKADSSPSTSQPSGYGAQYASSYPSMSRNPSQGTPSLVQSSYAPSHSSYPSVSSHMTAARNSYSGASSTSTSIHSPTGNAPPSHPYSSSASQQYAVRTPSQSYSLQSAPSAAITHSPHGSLKSPISASHTPTDSNGPMHAASMHFRTSATGYAVPPSASSAASNGDMSGLGISSAGSYGAHAQPTHAYGGYGPATSAFRSVGEVTAGSGTAQYAN